MWNGAKDTLRRVSFSFSSKVRTMAGSGGRRGALNAAGATWRRFPPLGHKYEAGTGEELGWPGVGRRRTPVRGGGYQEQLGRGGAELAWRSGGGGGGGEGGTPAAGPTLSGSSSCSAGRGRDIAAASTSRPLRAAQPGDRRRSRSMRCARDWRPGGVHAGSGSVSAQSRTCCHRCRCASLGSPAPSDTAASREPGSAPPPPPPDEPIGPGPAPHVTAQPGSAPQVWEGSFLACQSAGAQDPAQARTSSGFRGPSQPPGPRLESNTSGKLGGRDPKT